MSTEDFSLFFASFSLRDIYGQEINLEQVLRKGTEQWTDIAQEEKVTLKGSFLVFFPYAFSPVCSVELDALEAAKAQYDRDGIQLIGVSCDSHFALRSQVIEKGYTFEFMSDFWPHGNLSQACGVFDDTSGVCSRTTLLVDTQCRIVDQFSADISAARNPDAYLTTLEKFS